jgi:hypothetical protein
MPARPTPELMDRLYAAKTALHDLHQALPLREKIAQLIELQRLDYTLRVQRGEQLEEWQRPWEVEP